MQYLGQDVHVGKSDWRIRNAWQNYTYGLDTASTHIGTIGPCASVPMPIRTLSPAQSDRPTSANSTCAAQDRSSSRSAAHTTHRVLRTARWHELRSDTFASGTDQRDLGRRTGGNPRSGISKVAVNYGLASEAIAGEVEGDQVAIHLGSRLRTAQARSFSPRVWRGGFDKQHVTCQLERWRSPRFGRHGNRRAINVQRWHGC